MTKPATKPVPSPGARVDRPRGALELAVRTRNGDSTTTSASAMRPIVSRARKAYPAPMAAPTRAAAHDARSSRARELRSLPGGGAEPCEVVLEQLDEPTVFGEVTAPQRVLSLLVVLARRADEVGDRSRGRRRRRRSGRWLWRRPRRGRRCWGGRRRGLRDGAEELVEGFLERLGHDDAVLRREHHALQLRD